jgi:hypothetical protein
MRYWTLEEVIGWAEASMKNAASELSEPSQALPAGQVGVDQIWQARVQNHLVLPRRPGHEGEPS